MRGYLKLWVARGAAFLLLALAACAPAPADDAQIHAVFEQVRAGDVDAVAGRLSAGVQAPDRAAQLAAMRAAIPQTPPTAIRTLNWTRFDSVGTNGKSHTISAVQRYDYPDKVLVVETSLVSAPGDAAPRIDKFFIRVLTPREAAGTAFTLTGQSRLHYTVLAFLGFSLALMLAAIVATIAARNFRFKWLWCIVSLVTVSGLALNWNTGALSIPIKIGLINAGVVRAADPTAPWIVSAGFPVGAMLVFALLATRRRAS